ncbi:hypothetical protein BOTBODRAFT_177452 [Botryobasidium botryosum FD-172 SS1]|uniref:Velvet domain-containing protein n=1 Tax=Botryobasidium botryosum (strain FD-172 SS1) TaxID=930990 RepID=A0A067M600_BOTB1|nr:hypothetical protein BOTBODRAFT_177452 [Botryobasidium botryosum FD-172 SS1]
MAPQDGNLYELIIRQQPKQARMCGVGGKADRRPIDPPPIIQLRVVEPEGASPGPALADDCYRSSPIRSYLQSPYFFMFATLALATSDDELHHLKDGKTRYTTGSVVSSLYHLKDTENNGQDAGFFVFPDLCVRTEGSYRLKLNLYEVVDSQVHHCKSIFSKPFYVYTAKKFPGMEESTQLSISLADQGIKIRIRKDIRVRKRPIRDLSPDGSPMDNPHLSQSPAQLPYESPTESASGKGKNRAPPAPDGKRRRLIGDGSPTNSPGDTPWPVLPEQQFPALYPSPSDPAPRIPPPPPPVDGRPVDYRMPPPQSQSGYVAGPPQPWMSAPSHQMPPPQMQQYPHPFPHDPYAQAGQPPAASPSQQMPPPAYGNPPPRQMYDMTPHSYPGGPPPPQSDPHRAPYAIMVPPGQPYPLYAPYHQAPPHGYPHMVYQQPPVIAQPPPPPQQQQQQQQGQMPSRQGSGFPPPSPQSSPAGYASQGYPADYPQRMPPLSLPHDRERESRDHRDRPSGPAADDASRDRETAPIQQAPPPYYPQQGAPPSQQVGQGQQGMLPSYAPTSGYQGAPNAVPPPSSWTTSSPSSGSSSFENVGSQPSHSYAYFPPAEGNERVQASPPMPMPLNGNDDYQTRSSRSSAEQDASERGRVQLAPIKMGSATVPPPAGVNSNLSYSNGYSSMPPQATPPPFSVSPTSHGPPVHPSSHHSTRFPPPSPVGSITSSNGGAPMPSMDGPSSSPHHRQPQHQKQQQQQPTMRSMGMPLNGTHFQNGASPMNGHHGHSGLPPLPPKPRNGVSRAYPSNTDLMGDGSAMNMNDRKKNPLSIGSIIEAPSS